MMMMMMILSIDASVAENDAQHPISRQSNTSAIMAAGQKIQFLKKQKSDRQPFEIGFYIRFYIKCEGRLSNTLNYLGLENWLSLLLDLV